ncbi:MAG: transglutaminase-like domain-containing protein [Planctomycetota bacterium]
MKNVCMLLLFLGSLLCLTSCGGDDSTNSTDNTHSNKTQTTPTQQSDSFDKAPEGTRGANKRNFHFTYTAQISKPTNAAKKQRIWIPIPQTTAYQDISNLKLACAQIADFKYEMKQEDVYGNKMAYLEVADPKEDLSIVLDFDCVRYEHSRMQAPKNPEPQPKNKRYLEPSRLLTVDAAVREKAKTLSSGKTEIRDTLKAFYDEVINLVKYGKPPEKKGTGKGDGWGDGSTQWAREQCIGNCTDFHAYYMALCMASNIPARFEIGAYLLDGKTEGDVGYHCWALSWDAKNGWFPVDISEGWKGPNAKNKPELAEYYFGNHCVNRVQFTAGRDITLNPKQDAAPLNYFIYSYSEADGVLLPTTAKFQFKDL